MPLILKETDYAAEPLPVEASVMSPQKTGIYCRGELYAVVERKPNRPDGTERYSVDLTPPPIGLDGCQRREAFALAAEYARMMEKLFAEI